MMTKNSLLLPIVLLLLTCSSAHAATIAIDLGSEFLKVSLIKPGPNPIGIVVNEMSKRKSPALVGFANDERLLGEEALSFAVRYPETTYARVRDMLARPAGHPTLVKMLADHMMPYTVVPHPNRPVAGVQVKEGVVYSAEELVASIFQYVKEIAEAHAGAPIVDAVIAVPAFFGQAQRQALSESASLAGLNVMGLINSHTAAALQFGIERDFSNTTENVILYDMGSGSTEVALIRYSSYPEKGSSKNRISQLEVRDVDWDHELGVNLLDMALAKHFTEKFAEKYHLNVEDILGNAKAMAKMKKQARRTKEMLSANTHAPISVEEFYEGRDFQSSISREEFEGLLPGFFARAAAPLLRIIERNNLKPEDIDAVELLGGGSRVPRVQAALSEALAGRRLDRHLDSDEACVLGASLFAANLSTSFRLRRFGMADMTMYGVQMTVDEIHQSETTETTGTDTATSDSAAAAGSEAGGAAASPAAAAGSVRNLLPYLKKLPIKRMVHFSNCVSDPIRLGLAYNTSTSHGLPPGVDEPGLAAFEITGIDKVIEKYGSSGTINIRFEADYGGVVSIDKAEAVVEYTVVEERAVRGKTQAGSPKGAAEEKPQAEKSDSGAESEGSAGKGSEEEGSAGEEQEGAAEGSSERARVEEEEEAGAKGERAGGDAAKVDSSVKTIRVEKTKTAKVPLKVGGPGWFHPGLSGASLDAARATLAAWTEAEAAKRESAAAKNALESYIIKARDLLEGDDTWAKVTTEAQRSEFSGQLEAQEEWLYSEEGEAEAAPEFRARLRALMGVGEPIRSRAYEFEERPVQLARIRADADAKLKAAATWAEAKPWIDANETQALVKQVQDFLVSLSEKEAEQATRGDTAEPAFAINDVVSEYGKLKKSFKKLEGTKRPAPPPKPSPDDEAEEDDANEPQLESLEELNKMFKEAEGDVEKLKILTGKIEAVREQMRRKEARRQARAEAQAQAQSGGEGVDESTLEELRRKVEENPDRPEGMDFRTLEDMGVLNLDGLDKNDPEAMKRKLEELMKGMDARKKKPEQGRKKAEAKEKAQEDKKKAGDKKKAEEKKKPEDAKKKKEEARKKEEAKKKEQAKKKEEAKKKEQQAKEAKKKEEAKKKASEPDAAKKRELDAKKKELDAKKKKLFEESQKKVEL